MAGSSRFEIDGVLNASGIAKGAQDGKKALSDLEKAVGDVADESARSGGKVDTFASRIVDAARKAGKADDDIKDALRGMGLSARQAEEAVEGVGDEFQATGREGDRAAEKLEDSLKDVQRQAGKTSDEVGDVGERGFRKLGDAGEEVSGELKQNLGETFSSFRGELEDIPQLAQDVFGGLASSVGTLPAAFALAAGAAGVGMLVQGFQNLQKEEEERKQRVSEWAQAYIEAMGSMTESVANFASVEAIYTDTEKYAEAEKNAKNWGVSVSTAVNAMAGDLTSLGVAQENVAEKSTKVGEQLEAVGGDVRGLSHEYRTMREEANSGQTALDRLNGEMSQGQEIAAQYASSLYNLAVSGGTATGATDDLGNAIYRLPDNTEVVVDAKTQTAYENVDTLENKVQGVRDKDVNVNVRTHLADAQAALNRFVAQNDGRTIKINGRIVTNGGWNE